jgi:hypothetical protein
VKDFSLPNNELINTMKQVEMNTEFINRDLQLNTGAIINILETEKMPQLVRVSCIKVESGSILEVRDCSIVSKSDQ